MVLVEGDEVKSGVRHGALLGVRPWLRVMCSVGFSNSRFCVARAAPVLKNNQTSNNQCGDLRWVSQTGIPATLSRRNGVSTGCLQTVGYQGPVQRAAEVSVVQSTDGRREAMACTRYGDGVRIKYQHSRDMINCLVRGGSLRVVGTQRILDTSESGRGLELAYRPGEEHRSECG
ncbi:hypothetical protein LX32DRAFT_217802 [Colletotrichum zoysiae]|uniref:Uncharacterized protein n=1 Tax=Colletotrichum zoysiae TaxID=1216348 RepID=A0AAD9HQM9_9PEZI|nr:hypothetical protein LX32DRAFT_217802 [Colletotrichum zoysiae]